MFRYVVSLTLVLSFGSAVSAAAPPTTTPAKWLLNVDKGMGEVLFDAVGRPSALKIHGKGIAPRGQIVIEDGLASGDLVFDLETLDTGIKLRNEHMKQKYLETSKFSQAKLTLTKLSVPAALKADSKIDAAPFEGVLSLHGVQKPVKGMAKLARASNQLSIDANFGLKIVDYGINSPTFAGITMAEDVQITVEVTAPITQ